MRAVVWIRTAKVGFFDPANVFGALVYAHRLLVKIRPGMQPD
jgi:hypothetical protein